MATDKWKAENKDKLREYRKTWYKNNADHAKAKKVERVRELREWLNEYKSSLECIKCGERHIGCLEFHHREPDQKEVTISYAVGMGFSRERIIKEIEKCDVLCANCHRKHHWDEKISD